MTGSMDRRWKIGRICLGICLSVSLSGCAVSGRSMQLDSTSRMPWFNLELRERAKKSSGPAFKSVKSDGERKTRIDPLGLFGGKSESAEKADDQKKISLALPTTHQSPVLDSTARSDAPEFDFR